MDGGNRETSDSSIQEVSEGWDLGPPPKSSS